MIVYETVIPQMTVESQPLQVLLQPSTMNQSSHHNESCKRPLNTKCETIHKTQQ